MTAKNSQRKDGDTGELLPLDSPERVCCMQDRGPIYRHIFRRITPADWQGFFLNLRMDAAHGDAPIVGMEAASLRLYLDAIVRAEGCEMPDGRKPEEQPGWPTCIPRGHRLLAVDLLLNVTSSAGKPVVTDAKGLSVYVDALWGEGDPPGSVKKYFGLIHRFRRPTAEHRQRLVDAGKASFMMAGAFHGKAVLFSSNATLVALYDELIETVDGYSVGGLPLGSREQIVREMDIPHKAVSVGQIFPASSGGVN